MAWKWPWQKSDSGAAAAGSSFVMNLLEAHLADLRADLAAQRALVDRLLAQLAERDAQIRMVLEERYYRPVPAEVTEQRVPVVRPEEFSDVTQFDEGSDEDWLKRQDKYLAAKREGLEGLNAAKG